MKLASSLASTKNGDEWREISYYARNPPELPGGVFFRAAHPDSRVCTIIASRAVARRGLILLSWDERGKVTRVSRLDAVVQGRLGDDARNDSGGKNKFFGRESVRRGVGSTERRETFLA